MAWTQDKEWRKFERVVAAIHKFRDRGAEVAWDERMGRRQLDVTVRFQRGGYKYLLLVECKNYTKRISVEKVEALVTKSQRLHANKAIIVASSGFQQGAITEARHHGIDLYTLREVRQTWPEQFITV